MHMVKAGVMEDIYAHNNHIAEHVREYLMKRNVYTRIPVKVEYELTKKGKELEKSMREIEIWAENNL